MAFAVVGLLVAQSCASQTDTLEGAVPDIAYVYDETGRLRAVSVPDGETAVYEYDPIGNMTGVERFSSGEVSVIEVSPGRAKPGDEVVVHGTGFDRNVAKNTVSFGGIEAEVVEANEVELTAVVPNGAESGPVSVETSNGSASSDGELVVELDRTPVVTEVSPSVVAAGDEVVVRGENFTGDELLDQVVIGGTYATVVAASETELVVTVPAKASRGRVSVATPYGTAEAEEMLAVLPPLERPSSTSGTAVPASGEDAAGLLESADVGDWVHAELGEPVTVDVEAGEVGLVSFEGRARSRMLVDPEDGEPGSTCGDVDLGLAGPDGAGPPQSTSFVSLCGSLDEVRDENRDGDAEETDDDLQEALAEDEAEVNEDDEPGFALPWHGTYTLAVEPGDSAGGGSVTLVVDEVGTLAEPERLDDAALAERDEELEDLLDDLGASVGPGDDDAPTGGPQAPPGGLTDGLDRFPVDLSSGTLAVTETDLVVDDLVPLSLTRGYRPITGAVGAQQEAGAFGVGSDLELDVELDMSLAFQSADLLLPDSTRISYRRVSDGVDHDDALFEHVGTPTAFHGSTIVWNGWAWDLTLEDGTVLTFIDNLLYAVDDGHGNRLVVERNHYRDEQGREEVGAVAAVVSPTGRRVELDYDDAGRIVEARNHLGDTATYSYTSVAGADRDPFLEDHVLVGGVELRSAAGETVGEISYDYDEENRLTTVGDGDGDLVRLGYDGGGRVARQWLRPGATYEFDYTTETQTVEVPGEDGETAEVEVVTDAEVTDPTGTLRRVGFEDGHWVSDTWAVGTGDEVTSTAERDPESGFVTTLAEGDVRRSGYKYDEHGNPVSVVDGEGSNAAAETALAYDPDLMEVRSITDPGGYVSELGYDEAGNLTSGHHPGGSTIDLGHDRRGRVTSLTDGAGNSTEIDYELAHRVTVADPTGGRYSEYYDAAGRLAAATDPVGDTTVYRYNDRDQLVSTIDPSGVEIGFAYDEQGNLTSVTDQTGGTTSYLHDEQGRVVERTDPAGNTDTYSYEAGRLVSRVDRRGVRTDFAYDDLGQVTSIAFGVEDDGEAESTVDYGYDEAGRLVDVDDSSYGTVSFGYDELGRLVSETTPAGEVTYGYDITGRRTEMTLPDGTETLYDYDEAGRLTSITQDGVSVEAKWDDRGRVEQLDLPNDVTRSYSYDDRGLVSRIDYGDRLGALRYDYDLAGQRTGSSGDLAETELPDPLEGASYGDGNQLTGLGDEELVYDEAGNLVDDGTNTYTWDARGRLVAIDGDGLEAAFAYDPFGRRVEATVDDVTTSYLYDLLNVAQQAGDDGAFTHLAGLGLDEVYARTDDSGDVATYLTDVQGSVLGLVDGEGEVVTRYSYTPYGDITVHGDEEDPNPFGFTGREHDATGLHYYRARYYHPELGRFISEDPLGFDAGDTNLYRYVFGDPVNFIDPTGQQADGTASLGGCIGTAWGILLDDTFFMGNDWLLDYAEGRITEEEWRRLNDWLHRRGIETLDRFFAACGAAILPWVDLGGFLNDGSTDFGRSSMSAGRQSGRAANRFPNVRNDVPNFDIAPTPNQPGGIDPGPVHDGVPHPGIWTWDYPGQGVVDDATGWAEDVGESVRNTYNKAACGARKTASLGNRINCDSSGNPGQAMAESMVDPPDWVCAALWGGSSAQAAAGTIYEKRIFTYRFLGTIGRASATWPILIASAGCVPWSSILP